MLSCMLQQGVSDTIHCIAGARQISCVSHRETVLHTCNWTSGHVALMNCAVQGLPCTCRCCQAFRFMSACPHMPMHPPPASCTPSHHSSIRMMTSTHMLTAQHCREVTSRVGSSLVRGRYVRAGGTMTQGRNKPTQCNSQASNKVIAVQPPALTCVTVAGPGPVPVPVTVTGTATVTVYSGCSSLTCGAHSWSEAAHKQTSDKL